MSWEDSIALGAKAERRAIDAFKAAGWCCIAHGAAQIGRVQLPILTPVGERASTDFIALRGGDYRLVEVKTKTPLDRGGFGLDRLQWLSLLEHETFTPGRVLLTIEDRSADVLLVARIDHLKPSATWSHDERFVFLDHHLFCPLADFLKGHQKWLS
jgi:hypothetical protein